MLSNNAKIIAVDLEAKRRGMSYAMLSGQLTPEDSQRIYDAYECAWRKKRKKKE